MSNTLRASVLLGLLSGLWLVLGSYSVPYVFPSGNDQPPQSSYYPPWTFYIISPLVAFSAALVLLVRPMTLEKRGIVGFIAFVCSLPAITLILSYLAG